MAEPSSPRSGSEQPGCTRSKALLSQIPALLLLIKLLNSGLQVTLGWDWLTGAVPGEEPREGAPAGAAEEAAPGVAWWPQAGHSVPPEGHPQPARSPHPASLPLLPRSPPDNPNKALQSIPPLAPPEHSVHPGLLSFLNSNHSLLPHQLLLIHFFNDKEITSELFIAS